MSIFEEVYNNANKSRENKVFNCPFLYTSINEAIILEEAYKETNTAFLKDLILDIKNSKDNDFSNILKKYNIKIIIVDSDAYFNADYDKNTINFYINKAFLNFIKNTPKELSNLVYSTFASLYSHEDTHVQQLSKYNIIKNYRKYKNNSDINYFNQTIEAAAYGRQVAKFLKEQYPEKSIQELFNKLTDLSLEKEVAHFVNIYKDPAISKEAKQKFYRALFDELYR